MMPVESRLAGHLRLLGILWLALSTIRFLPGFVLVIMLDHGIFRGAEMPPFLEPLLQGVAAVLFILAVAGIATGWGLLAKQSWARMSAIVLGAVNLLDVPFGTCLGIYTFWVLLPAEAEQQYERLTREQAV